MYDRIIVPIDGAERALTPLPFAASLATAWGCPLEPLHVAPSPPPTLENEPAQPPVRHVEGEDPAAALIAETRATDPPALLCMATRSRTAAGELVFGSVTARIVRNLHAPLAITGPAFRTNAGAAPLSRLMVCLDGSATSAAIVPTARRWAQQLDLEVVLLHVAYPVGDPVTRQVTLPEETEEIAAELKRIADGCTDAGTAARWDIVEHTIPAQAIVEQAAYRGSQLIAMATHGRTGLERILAGSVTTEVLRRAPVPVLTLRPESLR